MTLDVRNLDEAEATVSVLRAVSQLAPGLALEVRLAGDLPFLYPELRRRGLAWTSVDAERGLTITIRATGGLQGP